MKATTTNVLYRRVMLALASGLLLIGATACVSVRTIPSIARVGDTVSMMMGGSEEARTDTVSAVLTQGSNQWDLQALGLVRSVFNLRADGLAGGMNYSPYERTFISWTFGHEPVQTVLVTDLPTAAMGLVEGPASLEVNTNAADDSGGIVRPVTIQLEIIAGTGNPDSFDRQDPLLGTTAAQLSDLEPAPYAKVSFGLGTETIGAASLVIDFDELVVDPDDLNVYVPQATVRGGFLDLTFHDMQRMVYWHHDGQQLFVDIVAPQGIVQNYLKAYVVQPTGAGDPSFNLTSATLYDTDGNPLSISGQPTLSYFP
jgi:hypothetical protein